MMTKGKKCKQPVDPDELQHLDELNVEWVKAWKKKVRRTERDE